MPARLPFWASSALARASSPRTSSEICEDRRVTSSPVVAFGRVRGESDGPRRGRLRGGVRRHGRPVPSPTCWYTPCEGSVTRTGDPALRGRAGQNIPWAHPAWQDVGVITLRSDSERRRRATAALQRLRPVARRGGRARAGPGGGRRLPGPARPVVPRPARPARGALRRRRGRRAGRAPRPARAPRGGGAADGAARDRPAPRGRAALVPGAAHRRLRRLHRPLLRHARRAAQAAGLPLRAGRELPAPDAAAQAAAGGERRRLRRHGLPRRRPPGRHAWTTSRPPPGRCASAG